MPVSISLGLWTTLLVYGISIPLGIRKAIRDGSRFDVEQRCHYYQICHSGVPSSRCLYRPIRGRAVSGLVLLRGLTSPGFDEMPWWRQAIDYLWHITLPVIAMTISGFAGLTMLTKNSFLDQINMQYVQTASQGFERVARVVWTRLPQRDVDHHRRFSSCFRRCVFTGSVLIETIFTGRISLLGFEALINRDYPVMFATVYVFTLLGLLLQLIGDVMYTVIDPRIDFESRG